ncbi:MAG: hypothetical protein RLZZ74_3294, partial [Cyanobacteriota bacterium]
MTNPSQEDNQTKELSKINYSLGGIVL